uniref:RE61743p n=1 Tax=Drosophila melanogaster TaxID=7227 RepID=D9PTW7_DROME|nr:RE61743p [Drosophila melanogaster]
MCYKEVTYQTNILLYQKKLIEMRILYGKPLNVFAANDVGIWNLV